MSKVLVITSGKGGVGKTTTTANVATGIALRGKKVVAIDFDVGLRNLDLVMGCERRVVYDLVNVIKGEARLQQALIKDKRVETLFVLPASQTRDKDALDIEGVGRVIEELKGLGFRLIGLEGTAQAALEDESFVGLSALVLGAEGKGLRELTQQTCDQLVSITTAGTLASLNVSNAAAVALHWAALQRKRASK